MEYDWVVVVVVSIGGARLVICYDNEAEVVWKMKRNGALLCLSGSFVLVVVGGWGLALLAKRKRTG